MSLRAETRIEYKRRTYHRPSRIWGNYEKPSIRGLNCADADTLPISPQGGLLVFTSIMYLSKAKGAALQTSRGQLALGPSGGVYNNAHSKRFSSSFRLHPYRRRVRNRHIRATAPLWAIHGVPIGGPAFTGVTMTTIDMVHQS